MVEDDLMTPTFKLKRPQLQKKYQAQVRVHCQGAHFPYMISCKVRLI